MAKIQPLTLHDGRLYGYAFYCPACQDVHCFYVAVFSPIWTFNGNFDAPSFSPSLRYTDGNQCHTIVQNGQINYCSDCKHSFAGKTVPMVDYDFERRCEVSTLHTINGQPVAESPTATTLPTVTLENPTVTASAAAATLQTHRVECGEVGEVGNVGELGSNAAKSE
jgi:hypothetical protein